MNKTTNNKPNIEQRPASSPIPLSENSIKTAIEILKSPQPPKKNGK
ncbi:hypothetical protein [Turicibacter sanguinis]|nr:hypothetical protein [Turicibacter sanguinis]